MLDAAEHGVKARLVDGFPRCPDRLASCLGRSKEASRGGFITPAGEDGGSNLKAVDGEQAVTRP